MRRSAGRLLSAATAAAPASPLAGYRRLLDSGAGLRTGYTDLFTRRAQVDRAPAAEFRAQCRVGHFARPTPGQVPGFVQTNLVAVPLDHAFDFLRFCLANPRSCPLLDVTEPGDPTPRTVAPSADLRTDLPRYHVWRDGEMVEECCDVTERWTDAMVGFLLGCSFSWEHVLADAGLMPRQIEEGRNVPMYRTNVRNVPVGSFAGSMVVSMRPYMPAQLEAVAALTSRYPGAHGAPIHWGDASALGVDIEMEPDFGERVSVRAGEVPVFWACGVTPQEALREARLPLAITHAPGHMFVTDLRDEELEVGARG